MRPFNPTDWYWQIGSDTSKFYSSAAVGFVPSVPEGFTATRIGSQQELADVLIALGVPVPAGVTASDDLKNIQISAIQLATLKGLLNHENRIRTLEGKQAMTVAQFVTAVKSLL